MKYSTYISTVDDQHPAPAPVSVVNIDVHQQQILLGAGANLSSGIHTDFLRGSQKAPWRRALWRSVGSTVGGLGGNFMEFSLSMRHSKVMAYMIFVCFSGSTVLLSARDDASYTNLCKMVSNDPGFMCTKEIEKQRASWPWPCDQKGDSWDRRKTWFNDIPIWSNNLISTDWGKWKHWGCWQQAKKQCFKIFWTDACRKPKNCLAGHFCTPWTSVNVMS